MRRRLSAVLAWFLLVGCTSATQPASPLDALDSRKLSDEEREIGHPKEIVAWLRGHTRAVASLAFSKDSNLLASSSWDNTVRVWRFGDALPTQLAELPGSPSGLAFAKDGRTLMCGGKDQAVHVWSGSNEFKEIRTLPGHKSRPFALAHSAAADLLVTACNDPVLRVWKWNNGEPETWGILANEQVESVGISSLSFSADGKMLAAGNYAGERSLRLWDVTANGLAERAIPKARARVVCFAPAGNILAFAGDAGTIKQWEFTVQRTTELSSLDQLNKTRKVTALAFSPDGKLLASAGSDKRVILWDTKTAKKVHDWSLREQVKTLSFAADSRHLAWGNEDGSIYIIRLAR